MWENNEKIPGVWFPEFIVIPPWPPMLWRPNAFKPKQQDIKNITYTQ